MWHSNASRVFERFTGSPDLSCALRYLQKEIGVQVGRSGRPILCTTTTHPSTRKVITEKTFCTRTRMYTEEMVTITDISFVISSIKTLWIFVLLLFLYYYYYYCLSYYYYYYYYYYCNIQVVINPYSREMSLCLYDSSHNNHLRNKILIRRHYVIHYVTYCNYVPHCMLNRQQSSATCHKN